MRAVSIVVAVVGGIAALVFAYSNIGAYLSGTIAQAILIPLAALLGAMPGLLLMLVSSRRPK